jgi:hypothetical protein
MPGAACASTSGSAGGDVVNRRRQADYLIQLKAQKPLYTWEADDGQGRRLSGVTDRRREADEALFLAMCRMPGTAKGKIRPARLDPLSTAPSYVYGRPLVRVRRDELTGGLVYGEGEE